MTVEALKYYYFRELSTFYPKEEIRSFYHILMEYQLGFSKSEVILKAKEKLKNRDFIFFESALSRLKQEIPIQYIIGETEFYGLRLGVNKNVLIPRPETEELVEWVLKDMKSADVQKEHKEKKKNKVPIPATNDEQLTTILDIGTGSGCIAIALAKNLPHTKVYAVDISEKALHIAGKNAKLNNVNVHFKVADILNDNLAELPNFDVIISNPPYVRDLEKTEMQNNVLKNEPHFALFVTDNDPLVFYRKIIGLAKEKLKKNGTVYFEINQYLAEETKQLMASFSSKITIKRDIRGNKRMIKASLND